MLRLICRGISIWRVVDADAGEVEQIKAHRVVRIRAREDAVAIHQEVREEGQLAVPAVVRRVRREGEVRVGVDRLVRRTHSLKHPATSHCTLADDSPGLRACSHPNNRTYDRDSILYYFDDSNR